MIRTDTPGTVRRGTAALLAIIGLAMATLVTVLVQYALQSPSAAAGQAVAQVAPTPAPDPTIGAEVYDLRLWLLGGLLLATVLAFAIIARLSRHSADD